ncbi:hypothetical protein VSR96_27510, partial [Klebsiella pneumoniae]|uniref:hypothetical protein n=1 Tax=Klebsiella pneumoniae TaxID=573 RepID=UPI002DB9A893
DFNIHASGCMTMHQCNIQRLRFRCFFVMSVATFSRLAPETQPLNITLVHSHAARCMDVKVTLKSAPMP